MKPAALLLGCGNDHRRRIRLPGQDERFADAVLVKLDIDPNCGADVVHDLDTRPLPFPDESFDELHCYDVLEHLGRQGDWKGYFDEFAEYWRILKPAGTFSIIVPIGPDAFADPGHTRFFGPNHFVFLSHASTAAAIAEGRNVTDYRWYWNHDFELELLEQHGDHHLAAILRKEPRTQ